jgi:hypothetical protein
MSQAKFTELVFIVENARTGELVRETNSYCFLTSAETTIFKALAKLPPTCKVENNGIIYRLETR